jgi:hypothetical protein
MTLSINLTRRVRRRTLKDGSVVEQTRYVLNWRDPRTGEREQRFFERQRDAQERRAELIAVRDHQASIGRGQKLVDAMFGELEQGCESREEIEAAIIEETGADRNQTRRAAMQRAVALPSRSTVMVNLASALKTLVGLERQAFNMDAPDSAANVNVTVNQVKVGMTDREALEAYMSMLEPPTIEG